MKKLRFVFGVVSAVVAIGLLMGAAARMEHLEAPSGEVGSLRLDPAPGVYDRGVTVNLRPYQSRGQIVVTVNGTAPSATVGTAYDGPIHLAGSSPGVKILRAVEITGDVSGPPLSASYVVGLQPTLPIISLIAEPPDLWGVDTGILTNPAWRGRDWERSAHVTGFLEDETFALSVGLRVDGREPTDAVKQSLRLYARQEYGVSRLNVSLFPDHAEQSATSQTYKRLLLQAGAHDVVWSLLRDQVTMGIARQLDLPVAEGRLVWLFVNGSSWGLYRLTERVDRFMLEDNFGLTVSDVVVEGDAREGSDEAWDGLLDWVATTDLREPANFDQFEARVDLGNLTDYLVLRELFGFPADALVAVHPSEGRWFWVLEGGSPSALLESDLDVLATGLLRNAAYRGRYALRVAELANTVVGPVAVSDAMSQLEPMLSTVFDHERLRWPGVPLWQDEVTALQSVLATRYSTLASRLDLTTEVTLRMPSAGSGALYVNGIRINAPVASWRSRFPPDARITVTAVPLPGHDFNGWEISSADGVRTVLSTEISLSMMQPLTVTAGFAPRTSSSTRLKPDDVVINEMWINDDGTRYTSLGGRAIEGDWVELLTRLPNGVDLRGWRLTDNDTALGSTEGSLILPDLDALVDVPCGTVILIVASETPVNDQSFPKDDLALGDGRLIFYVGNGNLDVTSDPGFGVATGDDNVVLMAPGVSEQFDDDIGIDFVAEGREVTPYTFGILRDGVTFDAPFYHLGGDDGALFRGRAGNDRVTDWRVDPSACESQDAECLDTVTLVTPGRLNPGQQLYRLGCLWR